MTNAQSKATGKAKIAQNQHEVPRKQLSLENTASNGSKVKRYIWKVRRRKIKKRQGMMKNQEILRAANLTISY